MDDFINGMNKNASYLYIYEIKRLFIDSFL